MRATEYLLEVVEEQVAVARNALDHPELGGDVAAGKALDAIEKAITELRKRGDTLIRRNDLLAIADGIDGPARAIDSAMARIQSALGGRLR